MSIESAIIGMAGRSEKKKKSEKSQEELRESFTERFQGLGNKTKQDLDLYDRMLQDGSFDDQTGEESGAGEIRKDKMQTTLSANVDRLEKMRAILDSGEDIPQVNPSISAIHSYLNEKGKSVTENITLSIEDTLSKSISFYQTNGIELLPDFQEQIEVIWQNNYDAIVEAIEKEGFDEILLAPANIPLSELSEKMKVGNGYGDYVDSSGSTVESLPSTSIYSQGVDKIRLILVHKVQNLGDDPRLKKTLNVKAQDTNPDSSLSLEDYIIFQKQYFEENQKHLDEKTATWTSKTKSGARFVCAYWVPSVGGLDVHACDPGGSASYLGCRPSRYFF